MVSLESIGYCEKEHQPFDDANQKISINFLDEYSLTKIFMLLPIPERMTMEKVCLKWKETCELAWCNIEKYGYGRSIGRTYNDEVMLQLYVKKLLLECGIYLKEISLSKNCTSSIMPIIGTQCKYLSRLEFVFNQRLQVNTDDYIQAFKKLDKLKYIKIKSTFLRENEKTKLDHKILDSLPEGITEIHLIYPYARFETPVFFNLKKYKNLHSLTLKGCSLDNIIQQISEQVPLVFLDLEYSSVTNNCIFKEPYIFRQLVNLEHFYCLNHWDRITSNSPSTIFNTCKNIKYFNESDSDLCRISRKNWVNLEKLENLTIDWILTDDLALKIVKYCKNLTDLHIKRDTSKDILEKLTELKNLTHLEYPLGNIGIESINTIVINCHKLRHLSTRYNDYAHYYSIYNDDDNSNDNDNYDYNNDDYDNCHWDYNDDDNDDDDDADRHHRVPSASIFDELSKLEYLEYLNMEYVENFQDSSLIAIANKCKNLEYLNIDNCKHITKVGLEAITRITSLRRLNVSYLKCVTNSFLGKLKGLTSLDCSCCKKITDAGIIKFIKNCPDLECIFLEFTRMTIKTIIAADQATKYRRNNIVLRIHISLEKLEPAFRSVIKSNWLVISYLE